MNVKFTIICLLYKVLHLYLLTHDVEKEYLILSNYVHRYYAYLLKIRHVLHVFVNEIYFKLEVDEQCYGANIADLLHRWLICVYYV